MDRSTAGDSHAQLRWELADAPKAQGALFDDPIFEREPGRGEFRGIEFLHVRARRIINEVPGEPRFGFRYTINPYRGCSHACSYCVSGDTPVLMGDGRTRPIADVHVGDVIYGTVRRGSYRRYVLTDVLAHWRTEKPAYRVTLEDGTHLVASGDHRFLTDAGWTEVCALDHRGGSRLHRPPLGPASVGAASARPGVVEVEPLGIDVPMYDITTGTGDFIANGVVSHNCFARPTHAYLDLGIDEDFERKLVVKVNAVERLRAELDPRRWAGELIAMGTNTDPYQRCEGKYRLTQGIVETLIEHANPFSILTKSTLILRDLDLLVEAVKRTDVNVGFSIGTLDEEVWRATEPGTPHPRQRMRAVEQLNAAGVACGVFVAPILPGLSDRPDQIEAVVRAARRAGASSISSVLLHLRPGVKEVFLDHLGETHPQLLPRYQRLYPGRRAYAAQAEQQRVSSLVRQFAGRPARRRDTPVEVRPAPPKPAQLPLL